MASQLGSRACNYSASTLIGECVKLITRNALVYDSRTQSTFIRVISCHFVALTYDAHQSEESIAVGTRTNHATGREHENRLLSTACQLGSCRTTLNTANIQLVTLIITSTRFCFPIEVTALIFSRSRLEIVTYFPSNS